MHVQFCDLSTVCCTPSRVSVLACQDSRLGACLLAHGFAGGSFIQSNSEVQRGVRQPVRHRASSPRHRASDVRASQQGHSRFPSFNVTASSQLHTFRPQTPFVVGKQSAMPVQVPLGTHLAILGGPPEASRSSTKRIPLPQSTNQCVKRESNTPGGWRRRPPAEHVALTQLT